MSSNPPMETESIPRLLVRFSGPAIAGLLAHALYNITDRVFVGRTVGSEGLAALSLAFPFMLLFIAFGILVGVGTSSRMAIQLGEKDAPGAAVTLGTGTTLGLVGSVAITFLGFLALGPLLRASGASGRVFDLAKAYLEVILLGAGFSSLGMGFTAVLRALGRPRVSMAAQFLGAGLNILLDAWWVLGMDWGVRGAAWATVLSELALCLWAAWVVFRGQDVVRVRLRHLVPQGAALRRIVAVGFPPGVMEMGFTLVVALMNRQVQRYGGDVGLSAMGIFFGLDALFFLPALGVGEGAQPLIGFNYGAGRLDRVRAVTWMAASAATVYFLGSLVVVELFAESLVGLFNATDPHLTEVASWGLRVCYAGAPLAGVSITAGYFFQGLGKSRASMVLTFCRFTLFILVPLLTLPPLLGLTGAWLALPVADLGGFLLGGWMMRRTLAKLESPGN
ncbi:MATE family efflux transporter [Aminomonas paucivorans]|uniref:MATE family efflux transporter n=1 Tax=Aminomonas paucivorans TaxID=81412 RepID=UPI00332BBEA0